MVKSSSLAPVVLFCYNRVDHLEKTLNALAQNHLVSESNLYIFSDGPRNDTDALGVSQVRTYLDGFKSNTPFLSTQIVKSTKNKGLARSIIEGVSTVINRHKKVIVIEDDVVTSPYFLEYINEALNKYEHFTEIGSIASYVPNINIPNEYNGSVFASMRPTSIAWGCWIDRWSSTDWDLDTYPKDKYSLNIRRKLNSWGNDVAGRLDRYVSGFNNSWAVRFTVSRMKQNQRAIHPFNSVSKHIGYDNSGTNSSQADSKLFHIDVLAKEKIFVPDIPPAIDSRIRNEYRKRHKRSIISEIGEFILVVILGLEKDNGFFKFARRVSQLVKMKR